MKFKVIVAFGIGALVCVVAIAIVKFGRKPHPEAVAVLGDSPSATTNP